MKKQFFYAMYVALVSVFMFACQTESKPPIDSGGLKPSSSNTNVRSVGETSNQKPPSDTGGKPTGDIGGVSEKTPNQSGGGVSTKSNGQSTGSVTSKSKSQSTCRLNTTRTEPPSTTKPEPPGSTKREPKGTMKINPSDTLKPGDGNSTSGTLPRAKIGTPSSGTLPRADAPGGTKASKPDATPYDFVRLMPLEDSKGKPEPPSDTKRKPEPPTDVTSIHSTPNTFLEISTPNTFPLGSRPNNYSLKSFPNNFPIDNPNDLHVLPSAGSQTKIVPKSQSGTKKIPPTDGGTKQGPFTNGGTMVLIYPDTGTGTRVTDHTDGKSNLMNKDMSISDPLITNGNPRTTNERPKGSNIDDRPNGGNIHAGPNSGSTSINARNFETLVADDIHSIIAPIRAILWGIFVLILVFAISGIVDLYRKF